MGHPEGKMEHAGGGLGGGAGAPAPWGTLAVHPPRAGGAAPPLPAPPAAPNAVRRRLLPGARPRDHIPCGLHSGSAGRCRGAGAGQPLLGAPAPRTRCLGKLGKGVWWCLVAAARRPVWDRTYAFEPAKLPQQHSCCCRGKRADYAGKVERGRVRHVTEPGASLGAYRRKCSKS